VTNEIDGSGSVPPKLEEYQLKRRMVLFAVALGIIIAASVILALLWWRTRAIVPSKNGLVLHIQSTDLNVLNRTSQLLIQSAADVYRGDGYLAVSDSAQLRLQGAITVSAWFKARSFEKAMTVAGRAYNGPPWQYPFLSWLIRINTNSVIEGDVGDGRSYSPAGWLLESLQPDRWYHVAMTYDGNMKALFLNGIQQNTLASGSQAYSRAIANLPGKPIIIGADESENPIGDVLDGSIDDVRLFNRALPETEIHTLFKERARKYGFR